jgi:CHAD domain-containing protein
MDLLHLVTPRADRLLSHVRGAQDGHPRDTHQARVASRRLEEALALTGGAGKRLDRDVRNLRRALGATRELDVTRIVFDHAALEHRWPKIAVDRVRRHLDDARARRHDKVADTLADVSVSRLRRRIREIGDHAASVPQEKLAERVRARVAKRERDFALAVKRAGAVYNIDKLHDVRLAIKKLRYTLELAQDALGRRWSKRLTTLKAQQAMLGELHDLQVLVGHVRVLEGTIVSDRGPLAEALAAIRRDLETESRRLHGRWLKQTKTKGT